MIKTLIVFISVLKGVIMDLMTILIEAVLFVILVFSKKGVNHIETDLETLGRATGKEGL